ncbi:predicted protein [Arabidopsis lyrata subsp. lyrata]|uniref:Predicted protein n=1 Tax=Arabidopsis lyrata subsp. lyrata TaxID=81972 RepID=D7M1U4_ARALL|nr:predicted protein [Arabidopsis lyrata subsp. lyrata]
MKEMTRFSHAYTEEEIINTVMLEVTQVPIVKGKRYRFGRLFDEGSTFTAPRHTAKLLEKIQTLMDRDVKKDRQLAYLMKCNKLLLQQFSQIQPPRFPTVLNETTNATNTSVDDDDDETQE